MKLLEPIKVGKITLKNRIMFPPMTTGYEERDGSIGEQSFNFYKRLGQGGVAYIVLGDVAPVNTVSPTPKLFHDQQIPAYKALADALHEYDCKLGIQVFHPEYDVDALAELFKKGDMQAARAKLHHDMLHYIDEVTEEQLNSILEKIGACVKRAYQAGVDIVEVHGDRLIGSLCSTILNHRTDDYGGSFENRIKFALSVVKTIKEGANGAFVQVSRSNPGFVKRLFELEVPEIERGEVEIKNIVREPGYRTKMSVYSSNKNLDPVGACVGNKGMRVNAIVNELAGEKIDIIEWSENPLEYIARALSPATVNTVYILDDKSARAVVSDDKLSLAIGKNGLNVRLAVKLTGWKIDVKSESAIKAIKPELAQENQTYDIGEEDIFDDLDDLED